MRTLCVFRGLVTSSKDSLDTYVSLILLPDKSKATKRKTTVKKKNLNPEFNERFGDLCVCGGGVGWGACRS